MSDKNFSSWAKSIPEFVLRAYVTQRGSIPPQEIKSVGFWTNITIACLSIIMVVATATGYCGRNIGFILIPSLVACGVISAIRDAYEKKRKSLLEFRRFVDEFVICIKGDDLPICNVGEPFSEFDPPSYEQIAGAGWQDYVRRSLTDPETMELYSEKRFRVKASERLDELADLLVEVEQKAAYKTADHEDQAILEDVQRERRSKVFDFIGWMQSLKYLSNDHDVDDILEPAQARYATAHGETTVIPREEELR